MLKLIITIMVIKFQLIFQLIIKLIFILIKFILILIKRLIIILISILFIILNSTTIINFIIINQVIIYFQFSQIIITIINHFN